MIPSYQTLAPAYDRLWSYLVPSPSHVPELGRICSVLESHQAVYEQASAEVWGGKDYWWYIAITDAMEGGGGADTYLGNGQRLDRVTTEVPAGRGPFSSFVAGCVDALRGVPAPTSVSRAAYNWEGYNGWGYLSKPIADPYLASWSNQYTKGKYVADHVYDPDAVSGQPGALTILKVLMPAYSPHGPVAPPATPETPPESVPPIVQQKAGHTMIDVTAAVKDLNIGLDAAEKMDSFLAMFNPALAAYVLAAIKGVRTIESSLGITSPVGLFDPAAVDQATNHVTPGAPNAAPLNG